MDRFIIGAGVALTAVGYLISTAGDTEDTDSDCDTARLAPSGWSQRSLDRYARAQRNLRRRRRRRSPSYSEYYAG